MNMKNGEKPCILELFNEASLDEIIAHHPNVSLLGNAVFCDKGTCIASFTQRDEKTVQYKDCEAVEQQREALVKERLTTKSRSQKEPLSRAVRVADFAFNKVADYMGHGEGTASSQTSDIE